MTSCTGKGSAVPSPGVGSDLVYSGGARPSPPEWGSRREPGSLDWEPCPPHVRGGARGGAQTLQLLPPSRPLGILRTPGQGGCLGQALPRAQGPPALSSCPVCPGKSQTLRSGSSWPQGPGTLGPSQGPKKTSRGDRGLRLSSAPSQGGLTTHVTLPPQPPQLQRSVQTRSWLLAPLVASQPSLGGSGIPSGAAHQEQARAPCPRVCLSLICACQESWHF